MDNTEEKYDNTCELVETVDIKKRFRDMNTIDFFEPLKYDYKLVLICHNFIHIMKKSLETLTTSVFIGDELLISYWEWLIIQEKNNDCLIASIEPILKEGYNAFIICDKSLTENPLSYKENVLTILEHIPSLSITGLEDKIKDITDVSIAKHVMDELLNLESCFYLYHTVCQFKTKLGNEVYNIVSSIFHKLLEISPNIEQLEYDDIKTFVGLLPNNIKHETQRIFCKYKLNLSTIDELSTMLSEFGDKFSVNIPKINHIKHKPEPEKKPVHKITYKDVQFLEKLFIGLLGYNPRP